MWQWLRRPSNQKLLALVGPAVAALAVAAWTVFTYLDQREEGSTRPSVQADHGVAAGRDIEGSRITIEGASDDDVGNAGGASTPRR
jgi:hypothetical protein